MPQTIAFLSNSWHTFDPISLIAAGLTAIILFSIYKIYENRSARRAKKAEQELNISRERYKEAQRVGRMGHWEYFFETDQLLWSEEVFHIFSMDLDSFQGDLKSFLARIHPEDRAFVKKEFNRSVHSNEAYDITHRILCEGGDVRHVRERCRIFYGKSGNPVRCLGTIHDITEQKRIEDDLRLAKLASESAAIAKSQFLANMSHEIRTPLNGVLGTLQLLEETNLDSHQKEFLDMAITSSTRLNTLLNDVLNLSQVEYGRPQLQREDFDLNKTIRSIVDVFLIKMEQKKLDFKLDLAKEIPDCLVGDATRLRHILFNLLGNAVKFTSSGSIGLGVHPLGLNGESPFRILFVLSDTGIGIPDGELQNIFTPFKQMDNSLTRNYQGAGLGLTVVQRLVSLMRGHLAIDNMKENGTSIYLALPLAPSKPKASTTN